MSLKLFQIEDGETHWIAAESILSALKRAVEYYSMELEDIESIEVVPGGKMLTVGIESYHDSKFPKNPAKNDRGQWSVAATVDEWLAIAEDGDMVCSTVW